MDLPTQKPRSIKKSSDFFQFIYLFNDEWNVKKKKLRIFEGVRIDQTPAYRN